MGMILALSSIDHETSLKLRDEPKLIWQILGREDAPESNSSSGSWFSRLLGGSREPKEKVSAVEEIDLDKSWHGIHYLLTRSDWQGDPPLNFLLCGGNEIGDIDVGYGTARLITAEDVQKVNDALKNITRSDLLQNFDPDEMTNLEIYPTIWDRASDEDDTFGYCADYFEDLKSFIARTAENGHAIVISIQ